MVAVDSWKLFSALLRPLNVLAEGDGRSDQRPVRHVRIVARVLSHHAYLLLWAFRARPEAVLPASCFLPAFRLPQYLKRRFPASWSHQRNVFSFSASCQSLCSRHRGGRGAGSCGKSTFQLSFFFHGISRCSWLAF